MTEHKNSKKCFRVIFGSVRAGVVPPIAAEGPPTSANRLSVRLSPSLTLINKLCASLHEPLTYTRLLSSSTRFGRHGMSFWRHVGFIRVYRGVVAGRGGTFGSSEPPQL